MGMLSDNHYVVALIITVEFPWHFKQFEELDHNRSLVLVANYANHKNTGQRQFGGIEPNRMSIYSYLFVQSCYGRISSPKHFRTVAHMAVCFVSLQALGSSKYLG